MGNRKIPSNYCYCCNQIVCVCVCVFENNYFSVKCIEKMFNVALMTKFSCFKRFVLKQIFFYLPLRSLFLLYIYFLLYFFILISEKNSFSNEILSRIIFV